VVSAGVPTATLAFLGFMNRRAPGPILEWARLRRDKLAAATVKAHPDRIDEIGWLANDFPGVHRPGATDGARFDAHKVGRELIAVAAPQGVAVDETFAAKLDDHLSHSVETFDQSVTTQLLELRDIAANYARDLPDSRWTDAEILRNALAVAIERDNVGEQLCTGSLVANASALPRGYLAP
jgi:hypothetical protein